MFIAAAHYSPPPPYAQSSERNSRASIHRYLYEKFTGNDTSRIEFFPGDKIFQNPYYTCNLIAKTYSRYTTLSDVQKAYVFNGLSTAKKIHGKGIYSAFDQERSIRKSINKITVLPFYSMFSQSESNNQKLNGYKIYNNIVSAHKCDKGRFKSIIVKLSYDSRMFVVGEIDLSSGKYYPTDAFYIDNQGKLQHKYEPCKLIRFCDPPKDW